MLRDLKVHLRFSDLDLVYVKRKNGHPFKVNELCCAALLGLVAVIEGSPSFSLSLTLRECEKYYQCQTHPQAVYTCISLNMKYPLSDIRLIPCFVSVHLFCIMKVR